MEIMKIEDRLEKDLRAMFDSKQFEEKMTELKEVEDDENYKFKVVVTTEWKDRDGEILKADGIDFDAYMKNPVVLIDHSYKIESIVGKTLKIYQEGGKTIAEWVFAKGIERAEIIRSLYNQGFIKTVSIGFISKNRDEKDRTIIDKSEMLEFSFVAVPANPEALSLDGKQYQKALDFGIVKSVEKKNVSASELNVWDSISYRATYLDENEEGETYEQTFPAKSELPMMWKIISIYRDSDLLDWNKIVSWTEENPFLIIQSYVASEKWPILLRTNVSSYEFKRLKIESVIEEKKISSGEVKFTSEEFKNEDKIDLKSISDNMEALRQDFSEMKSGVKTLVDDKTEEKNLSKLRELGKEFQKSLSAFNKETKSQK